MFKVLAVCVGLVAALGAGYAQPSPQLPYSHGTTVVDGGHAGMKDAPISAPVSAPVTPTLPTEPEPTPEPEPIVEPVVELCGPDIIIFCDDMLPLNNGDGWVPTPSTYTVTLEGEASWYEMGHTTSCGYPYNPDDITVALAIKHMDKAKLCGAPIVVTYNGKTITAAITDTMPDNGTGRIVDLSRGTRKALGMGDLGHVVLHY